MTEFWPWLALAGLGAFHGLNPAMGWLFAVALGLHRRSRVTVFRALPPIAFGHALSIAIVAGAMVATGALVNRRLLLAGAGFLLIGWAIYHQLYGHRHRVRVGMRTGQIGLVLWSFLMATAHGAGLMLVPALIPLCLASSPGHEITASGSLGVTLAAVCVHTGAMLAVTAAIAIVVYEWLGLAMLRTAWLNVDLVWTAALVTTGLFLLLTTEGRLTSTLHELGELDGGVGEAGRIDRPGVGRKELYEPHVARVVDCGAADGNAAIEIEEGEASVLGAAAPDQLVPAFRRPRSLQIDVVLVGPEPRQLGIGLGAAGHHLGDRDRLVLGVLPSLQPDAAAEQRIEVTGDVAGGKDMRIAGAAMCVDQNAVIDREIGLHRQLAVRHGADADENCVGGQRLARPQRDHGPVAARCDRSDGDAGAQIDAAAAMEGGEELAEGRRCDARQRSRGGFQHGHRAAMAARYGCCLQPDEAGADDDQPLAGAKHAAQLEAIVDVAQVVDAPAGAARNSEMASACAERQEQRVIRQGDAVGETQALRRAVDLEGRRAEMKIDPRRGPELQRLQIRLLDRAGAGEQLLRQRRALIGRVGLAADQHDLAGKTGGAQRLRRAPAGMAGAEDDDEVTGILTQGISDHRGEARPAIFVMFAAISPARPRPLRRLARNRELHGEQLPGCLIEDEGPSTAEGNASKRTNPPEWRSAYREDGMSTTHHDVLRSARTTKRVSPAKLAHVVLRVRDLPAMRDWYKIVLQAEVTQESDMLCFLTYDDEHHRIALVAIPGLEERGEVRRVGMDHIAFTYASVGDLFHTYERLRDAGITPFWPINHGVTLSLYYRDPEGNRIELQVDAFATMDEGKTYMRSDAFKTNPVGVVFDPEELLRRFRAGETAASLLRRPPLPQGKTPMDMLRL